MITETVRPSASTNTGFTLVGGPNLHSVLADELDGTYAHSATIYNISLSFPSPALAADHERHRFQIRIRDKWGGTPGWNGGEVRFPGISPALEFIWQMSSAPTIHTSQWSALVPATGATAPLVLSSRLAPEWNTFLYAVYLDFDNRHKPTFVPKLSEGGVEIPDGGTFTDTNRPDFEFTNWEYDGLTARSWTLRVKKDGALIWEASGDGQPSSVPPIPRLDNGTYTAEFQIFSNIRDNQPFASNVQTLTFTVNFVPVQPYIDWVIPDCALGGYVISVFSGEEPPQQLTVMRHDLTTGGLTPVRGLANLAQNISVEVVDYEAPLYHDIVYWLYAGDEPTPPAPIGEVEVPLAQFGDACGTDQMYLRWLFDPKVMTSAFCLGPIGELGYQPRAGVFVVIGRSDPVVVVDQQETARGTLRLIGRTTEEVEGLRSLLTRSAQPTLLTFADSYMLGKSGQLYFQPLAVKEQWLNPDNRIPQHAFTIDYVEIAPPALTQALLRTGAPFGNNGWITWSTDPPDGTPHGDPNDCYKSFNDLLTSGNTFDTALYDDLGTCSGDET
jgi:hypothetical protein